MKRALRFFTYFLFFLGCIALFLWGAGSYFNKEVKQAVVNTINKQLVVPVDVREIELTLFKDFPNAAVELNKVLVPKPSNDADTLLYADQVFLSFNLWDVFKGSYTINRVKVVDGELDLQINPDGVFDYKFWKSGSDTISESKAQVNLSDLVFKNINTRFRDTRNNLRLSARALNAKLSGQFADETFNVESALESPSFYFAIRDQVFFEGLSIDNKVNLLKRANAQNLVFEAGNTQLKNFETAWQGAYNLEKNTFELSYATAALKPIDLKPFFPKSIEQVFTNFIIDGNLKATGKLFDSGNGMQILCDFDLQEGVFKKESQIELSKIKLAGTWQSKFDETSDFIQIDNFSTHFLDKEIKGSASLRNFSNPTIQGAYQGSIDYAKLVSFYKLEKQFVEQATVNFNLRSSINLQPNASVQQLIQKGQHSGLVTATLLEGELSGKKLRLDNVQMQLANKGAQLTSNLRVGEAISASVVVQTKDVFRNIFEKSGWLSAKINANTINVDAFLQGSDEADKEESASLTQFLPERLHIGISLNSDKLIYSGANFDRLKATVSISNKHINWRNTQVRIANGDIMGEGSLEITSYQSLVLETNGTYKQLELAPFFSTFNNFGQDIITQEMIQGKAYGDYNVRMLWDKNGVLQAESTQVFATTTIVNGQLKNVPLLADISAYLRKNLITKTLLNNDALEKRMQIVDFDTLKNEISLRNGVLLIPEMEIKSSAFNLNTEATYQLASKNVDAGFSFMLSELFQKRKPAESEFGYIVEEPAERGLKLYLRMQGTPDDIKFSLDKVKAKNQRKERLKEELNVVKDILKNPTKKSTTEEVETAAPQFELDWNSSETSEENATESEEKEGVKDNKKGKTSIFNLKPKKEEKTETEEFDFSEDDF